MARRDDPTKRSNEMENRDPTIDEISSVIGVSGPSTGNATERPLEPYDHSRDDDNPDDHPQAANRSTAAIISEAQQAGVANPLLERMEKAMASIERRMKELEATGKSDSASGGGPGDGFSMTDVMVMMMQQQQTLATAIKELAASQRAQVDIQQRATLPENKFGPEISDFNPRGDRMFPRPRLKCEMFVPFPLAAEVLSREEIELYNLLAEPTAQGEYMVLRNDKSKVKVTVRQIQKLDSDEASRVTLTHDTAFSNVYHRSLPAATDMLRHMFKQKPSLRNRSAAVLTMDEELALIAAGQLNDGTVPADGRVVSVGQ